MNTQAIAAEIRALRKGRAVDSTDLATRIGPCLRDLVSGAEPAALRRELAAALATCARRLPADLGRAIMASLALSTETKGLAHFSDRMAWLAGELGFGYRTALRRVEAAERLLAEEIGLELRRRQERPAGGAEDWYLDELRTILRLDTPTPESHEHRRIVATRDGLTEITAWLDIPPSPDAARTEVAVDVLYGGRLIRQEHQAAHRFRSVIRLPLPLRAGQRHDFGLVVRIPEGQAMRPHYILTPESPCNAFVLRVRFDPLRLPRWVRRVEAETVRMFDSGRPSRDLLVPDAAGEVQVEFSNPRMYLGYGVQWQP